jgi:hypothetical protein
MKQEEMRWRRAQAEANPGSWALELLREIPGSWALSGEPKMKRNESP